MNTSAKLNKMARIAVCSNCYDNVERGICSGHKKDCSIKKDIRFALENLNKAGYDNIIEFAESVKNMIRQWDYNGANNLCRGVDKLLAERGYEKTH